MSGPEARGDPHPGSRASDGSIEGDAVPARPTPSSARRTSVLGAGLLLLLGTAITLAPAAGAVEDVARPDYRVVSGPSFHPGGVQIEVVAGTLPYSVVLATTRQPDGEDSAEL